MQTTTCEKKCGPHSASCILKLNQKASEGKERTKEGDGKERAEANWLSLPPSAMLIQLLLRDSSSESF